MRNILFLIVFALALTASKAEEGYTYDIGFGIKTSYILGDNAARAPIVRTDTNAAAIIGGSFEMVQPGLEFRFTSPIFNNFRLMFNYGIDFFSGRERIPLGPFISDFYHHRVNLHTFNLGIQYVYAKIKVADSRFYVGLEPQLTLVNPTKYYYKRDYRIQNELDVEINAETKEATTRLGGLLRLGVDGRLKDDIYVNISGGFSMINLIGADNARGELLTIEPSFSQQETENLLQMVHFSIMLQYKFK